jgi:long-chain acyl-CoA synthetase
MWRRKAKQLVKPASTEVDTLPKLLLEDYSRWGNTKVAMRRKRLGIWREYTWEDYYVNVKCLSLGLVEVGLQQGDTVAIIGDSNPEWFWAELAVQAAGGVVTGFFPDATPSELEYILRDCEARFVVAQDQEQVDKLIALKDHLPSVERVIYWQPKGMRDYDDPMLISFDELLKQGQELERSQPALFEQNIARGKASDIGLLLYTSGTSGRPRRVGVTYGALISNTAAMISRSPVCTTGDRFCFALPFWGAEQIHGLVTGLTTGQILNFPETQETVEANIVELSPTIMLGTPRLWERIATNIQDKISSTGRANRFIFRTCLSIGYRLGDLGRQSGPSYLFWRSLFGLAHMILFRPLKSKHGLQRCRCAYSTGAFLGTNVIRFFRAIGFTLRQAYWSAETQFLAVETDEDSKLGPVGPVLPGMVLRVSEEGEILSKSGYDTQGYCKEPEATKGVIKGGWLHTGDMGQLDSEGLLTLLGSLTERRQIAKGGGFCTQHIESQLRFSPYIRDAFVFAGEDDFLGAIICVNFENVTNWAIRKGITYSTFGELCQRPEVCQLMKEEIKRINDFLRPGMRVNAFVNLNRTFDPGEGELTRNMKLRRTFVADRFRGLVDGVCRGKEELILDVGMVDRHGNKRVSSASIRVNHIE